MSAINRITFLSICDELDVKGKCSGKLMVHEMNKPVDILGFYLQREQYVFINKSADSLIKHPSGHKVDPYTACCNLLALHQEELTKIFQEIDLDNSTNESIRQVIREVFAANPIPVGTSCSVLF